MKLLIKERGGGKTTGLIYASEATGYPICATVQSRVNDIIKMAEEIGCNIPQPITVTELRNGDFRGSGIKNILFDDVGEILGAAVNDYLGVNVIGATMSDYEKERQNYKLKAR